MNTADLEAAGLYDPRAANAADRLALLEWLAARGVTLEQMVAAARERLRTLTGLAGDLALRPGVSLTLAQLAARTGLAEERIEVVRLASGLPPVDAGAPAFSEDDAPIFTSFALGAEQFGEDAIRRFARVVGSCLANVAEAAVALFFTSVEDPIHQSGAGELALARANLRAIESLQLVTKVLDGLFRLHMETAIRRLRGARQRGATDVGRLTVGFVDMVGFTTLSRRVSPRELASLVDRFEDTAHTIATERDGRVVKLIGDEVMFVTRDPDAACDIAVTLLERFSGDASITPRGGLACGEVIIRSGDYYGPIVNLAARLAELAVPRELLVTPEVAGTGRPGLRFAPAGRRLLKGFDEPVTLLTVERAPAS